MVWNQPLLKAHSAAGRLRAWTGGTAPQPLAALNKSERSTVRAFFREQLNDWVAYWKELPPLDVRRTFWRRARYDAHATHREMAS